MNLPLLWMIAVTFASLSLAAIGGGVSVIPEIHRQIVVNHHWMSDAAFTQAFAVAHAAPGPNILMVSLFGLRIAGFPGLAVATLGMLGPTSVLAFAVGRLFNRLAHNSWVSAIRVGLVPVAVGLMLAAGLLMARPSFHSPLLLAMTIGAACFVVFTDRNPLWAIAAATLISLLHHFGTQ